MAIVGAFLGGPGTIIPTGYHQLSLQWITSDGQNLNASVQLTGPETKTVQLDSSGKATVTVQSGTYVMSLITEGNYSGTQSKTETLGSGESSTVVWFGTRIYPQTVTFSSPANLDSATYKITNTVTGETEAQGAGWNSTSTFVLYPGDHNLELTYAGTTVNKPFSFGNSATSIDLSDLFCRINISFPSGMTPTSIKYNSVNVPVGTSINVLRTSTAATIVLSGGIPSFAGVSTSSIADWNTISVTPSQESVSVTATAVGKIVLITASGSLTVPVAGKYDVACIGGGGGGGGRYQSYNGGGGGGGGHVSHKTLNLTAGSQTITIGSGGSGGPVGGSNAKSGGVTSFGSLLSATGGGYGTYSGSGGSGGSGGGGMNSGDGDFGGGGGSSHTNPGTGGTFGGDGGSKGESGNAGTSASSRDDVFQSSDSYSGGASGGTYGGGGGGGGLGARGGGGGSGVSIEEGGAGGGGGIAGGNGGSGGRSTATDTGYGGSGGRGYGAGGGGAGHNSGSRSGHGGGGGGGGYGSSVHAGNGKNSQSFDSTVGGAGQSGCVLIRWMP